MKARPARQPQPPPPPPPPPRTPVTRLGMRTQARLQPPRSTLKKPAEPPRLRGGDLFDPLSQQSKPKQRNEALFVCQCGVSLSWPPIATLHNELDFHRAIGS